MGIFFVSQVGNLAYLMRFRHKNVMFGEFVQIWTHNLLRQSGCQIDACFYLIKSV